MAWERPTLSYLNEIGVRDGTSDLASYGGSDNAATRKFRGRWEERNLIAPYFLGNVRIGSERLERITPLPHPTAPNFFASYITVDRNHKVNGKELGVTDVATSATYLAVDFTVHYTKPKYRVLTDEECPADEEYRRWMDLPETRPHANVLTVPVGGIQFIRPDGLGPTGSLPLTVPYNLAIVQSQVGFTFWWRDLPFDLYDPDATPSKWWKRLTGGTEEGEEVASYLFTTNRSLWKGMPPGTMLLNSARMIPRPSPVDGELGKEWDIGQRWDVAFEVSFLATKGGWNSAYYNDRNGTNSGYYYATRTGDHYYPGTLATDNVSLYNEREFADLTKVT